MAVDSRLVLSEVLIDYRPVGLPVDVLEREKEVLPVGGAGLRVPAKNQGPR